jgi:iron-sulfur cluster insertion protein
MKLDPTAVSKIKQLIAEENDSDAKLRVFVQGGGCSGMQYGFTFDNTQNEDDWDFDYDGVTVLVDAMSMEYLREANISWRETDISSSFVIDNPQAQTTCGCGSSFSV